MIRRGSRGGKEAERSWIRDRWDGVQAGGRSS